MNCSRCGRSELHRIARRGTLALLNHSLLGRWPWKCSACQVTRYLHLRNAPEPFAETEPPPAPTAGPSVTCRAEPGQATAAVVIKADSGEQLTHILLALARAVETEKAYPRAGTARERQTV